MSRTVDDAPRILHELDSHLREGILPFWLDRGVDRDCGGFLTTVDEQGVVHPDEDKYLVTQTRMIWGFSHLHRVFDPDPTYLDCAKQGVDFLLAHFWDAVHGGFIWRTRRDGTSVDRGKVVYGQAFAIYALAEYGLASGDPQAQHYAEAVFDALQSHCADTVRGGYYENLEEDWSLSGPGIAAGDRKSLDIHMHLMEAFTVLVQLSGKQIHARALTEVIDIILTHMVDLENGCGRNQFSLDFQVLPAINIARTWNAERASGEVIEEEMDSTSYGHNMELIWLLYRAAEVLGRDRSPYDQVCTQLAAHCLQYGFDHDLGGVFRDGPHAGPALVRDKEWWQNAESLVGFLAMYERFGDPQYFQAFATTWAFCTEHFIHKEFGEWRQLLTREGAVISGLLGNPWKAIYHTGRAISESRTRLARLLA